jgi:hypothetical protein
MEDIGSLQFGVEKAKIKWGTYLRDVLRGGSASSQFESYSGNGPSVIVQNAREEKRVVEVTRNVKEARERAAAIENDYKVLSTAEWCERYDVPASFVTG